jgi:hypothetical protein
MNRLTKPRVLIAGLVVAVAVVVTVVVVSVSGTGPTDVVRDYLDAIRAGDTEAALAIAGEPKGDGVRFLSADALADDWTVDHVAERHRTDDDVDIDVTLRAGEHTEQGRFQLTNGDDGWTIDSPFVQLDLSVGELDTVELGTVREPVRGARNGSVALLVFPGVYEPYPSMKGRFAIDPAPVIVPPQEDENPLRVTLDFRLTKDGAANATGALTRYLDDCVTKTGAKPSGCPFSAEDTLYGYADVRDVTWELVTAPEPSFVPARDRLVGMVVRKPGVVRLTATAVEDEGGQPTTVTAECDVDIASLVVTTTMAGFTVRGAPNAYLRSRCY